MIIMPWSNIVIHLVDLLIVILSINFLSFDCGIVRQEQHPRKVISFQTLRSVYLPSILRHGDCAIMY